MRKWYSPWSMIVMIPVVIGVHARSMADEAHTRTVDSLRALLRSAPEQQKPDILNRLSGVLEAFNPEESRLIALEAIRTAQVTKNLYEESRGYLHLSDALRHIGQSTRALDAALRAGNIASTLETTPSALKLLAQCHAKTSISYRSSAQYDSMLVYAEKAMNIYRSIQDNVGQASIMVTLSYVYWNLGQYAQGLPYGLKALQIYEALRDEASIARTLNIIGLIYRTLGDNNKAMEYSRKCLLLRQKLGDRVGIGVAMSNIGFIYKNQTQYDSALVYFIQYLRITEELKIPQGLAIASLNIGVVYRMQGKPELALTAHTKALEHNTALSDKRGIASSLCEIGADLRALGRYSEARSYLHRAINAAETIPIKTVLRDSYKELAQVYSAIGQDRQAYQLQVKFHLLNDTLINANRDQIIAIQNRHEQEQHERDNIMQEERIAQQNVVLNLMLGALILLVGVGIIILRLYQKQRRIESELRETNKTIEREREHSDFLNHHLSEALYALEQEQEVSNQLLLNVLPESIAARMKAGEKSIAEHFPSVTVVFVDLVGFTQLALLYPPTEVVEFLDSLFSKFDGLAEHHGVEKIKTIGDAYLAVCGVPNPVEQHTQRIAHFALDIRRVVEEYNESLYASKKHLLHIRIGIHRGEVIAGIIGTSKFSYDLWGDTVNTASRMESHGEPGKIHCTEEVYHTLKNTFTFEARGAIEIKGKGTMNTWFLTGE